MKTDASNFRVTRTARYQDRAACDSPIDAAGTPLEVRTVIGQSFSARGSGSLASLYDFRCRTRDLGAHPEEYAAGDRLVLVRRGAFAKHVGRALHVADVRNAAIFRAAESYRVSHPRRGGDDCTVLAIASDLAIDCALFTTRCGHNAHTIPVAGSVLINLHHLRRDLALGLRSELLIDEWVATVINELDHVRDRHASSPDAREVVEHVKFLLVRDDGGAASLSRIARDVGRSPFHLARVFRRMSGESMHQYRLRARCAESLGLLLDTKRSISDLAHALGFASHSHYTSTFRRYHGVTPQAVRQGVLFRPGTLVRPA